MRCWHPCRYNSCWTFRCLLSKVYCPCLPRETVFAHLTTTIFLHAGSVSFLHDGWLVLAQALPFLAEHYPCLRAEIVSFTAFAGFHFRPVTKVGSFPSSLDLWIECHLRSCFSVLVLLCESGEDTVSIETYSGKAEWNFKPLLNVGGALSSISTVEMGTS